MSWSTGCLIGFIQTHWGDGVVERSLTWVLSTTTPLDEAHDEQDQDDEGDGAHEANEPALSGDVDLVDVGWGRGRGGGDSGTMVKVNWW